MRFARNLLLVALAAIAAMAMAASSASAITVMQEGGSHCPKTVTEGDRTCIMNGASDGHMELGGPFGVMYICDVKLEANVNEKGAGWGYNTDIIESTCEGLEATDCETGDEKHWPYQIGTTITPSSKWNGQGRFCAKVLSEGSEIHCDIPFIFEEVSHNVAELEVPVHTACVKNTAYSLQGVIKFTSDDGHGQLEATG
jgi:hypothetical protein